MSKSVWVVSCRKCVVSPSPSIGLNLKKVRRGKRAARACLICCQRLGCWGLVLPGLIQTILEERKKRQTKRGKDSDLQAAWSPCCELRVYFYCGGLCEEHFIYRVWLQAEVLVANAAGNFSYVPRASLVLRGGWPGCMNGSAGRLGQWSKTFVAQQLFLEANSFLSKLYSKQPPWKVIVNFF